MALDGVFLSIIKAEIEQTALGGRVDRISQPSREEVIFSLRCRGGGCKLLLSANADSPRIHFTETSVENPKTPPMFCMLLRKHLSSGKLIEVRQMGVDRILHLIFESVNEMGDLVQVTVAVEIMGRHSNIILIDQNNRILDAVKRVDEEMSSVRQILPGMSYTLPPPQLHKVSLMDAGPAQIVERVYGGRDVPLSKGLMEVLQGVSPIVCRELSYYATRGADPVRGELTQGDCQRLEFALKQLTHRLKEGGTVPTMVLEPGGKPKDFSFMEIHQYGQAMATRTYGSGSQLLDAFYSERDAIDRMKQRSHDLLKMLVNATDRIARKLETQRQELLQCGEREWLKQQGDLLSANLYRLEKGMTQVELEDFYADPPQTVRISLDPMLTPVQNVQKYYSEYRKADTAERMLTSLITQGEEELAYLESVFDLLTRSRTESELNSIREELAGQGYIKHYHFKNKKPERIQPLKYRSTDGFLIYAGRNNVQNDRLTLKDSNNNDIWFHTQKIPGSHTVIVTDNREVPNRTLEEAAIIAAYTSRARSSALVPVDYTPIRNVKKPAGAKPGMVIYDRFKTAIVTPDEELVSRLQL